MSISSLGAARDSYRAALQASRPETSLGGSTGRSTGRSTGGSSGGSSRAVSASALAPDLALANAAREGSPRGLALEAARTLVTEAFVKPVFAQMQEGSLAAGPFKPGVGERRFRPLLDAALAGKVVEGSNFQLVERLADRFERAMDPNAAAREVAKSRVPIDSSVRAFAEITPRTR